MLVCLVGAAVEALVREIVLIPLITLASRLWLFAAATVYGVTICRVVKRILLKVPLRPGQK